MTAPLTEILDKAPVIPVIVIHDLAAAVPLADALVAGGLPVLEVTLRTPVGLAAVEAMRRAVPEAIVGVGTLTEPAQFAQAASAGAQFGVSPGLTPAMAQASRTAGFPYLPGVMTPGELMSAREQGFSCCKLFPAQQAGGIGMLKALHAVFPDVRFCPTGGVSRDNAPEFLALPNVLCVGGSWVAPPDLVRSGDWLGIRKLAQEAAALKRAAAPR
jgi:2-dehydro-3-deoxyphosphogluconate aldolase/(4S)-4-hydroxy-2-oxoglutarate aldolase